MTRVFSDDVLYMGWNAYGSAVQLVPVGSNLTCAKPLAGLAVIDPNAPVVRSRISTVRPLRVSCSVTVRRSPGFISRSLVRSGVNVRSVESTGLAGAWLRPFLVTNAKFQYSMPTFAAQSAFCRVPFTGSASRPKRLSAAHHLVGSQPPAPTACAHVGHGIQPGG